MKTRHPTEKLGINSLQCDFFVYNLIWSLDFQLRVEKISSGKDKKKNPCILEGLVKEHEVC